MRANFRSPTLVFWFTTIVAVTFVLADIKMARPETLDRGINVRPVRLSLSAETRSAAVTITNGQATAELMRVEVVAWDQDGGIDRYTPTGDLLVVPPVLAIAADRAKVVRVGLRRPIDGNRERAYRIFITEVPPELDRRNVVQVAFRFAIPLFVGSHNPSMQPPNWRAKLVRSGRIDVTATNPGDTHVRIETVRVYADRARSRLLVEQPISDYLLAGATRTLAIDVAKNATQPTLVVQGIGPDGTFDAVVSVSKV